MTFYNVGFSNTVGSTKYLTCADCETGPIGYYDIPSKISYVALSRVLHANSNQNERECNYLKLEIQVCNNAIILYLVYNSTV